jgi:hypothetical protein
MSSWSPERPTTWPTAPTTHTAQWSANQITVTLNAGTGGSWANVPSGWTQVGTGQITQIQREQAAGSAVTWPVDPTRIGYRLSSWSFERPTTWPLVDSIYTAHWTAGLVIPSFAPLTIINYIDGSILWPETNFVNTIPSEAGVISISVDSFINYNASNWMISHWSISYAIWEQYSGFVRSYQWHYEGEMVGADNVLTHRLPATIDLENDQWDTFPVFRVYLVPDTLIDRTELEEVLAEAALLTQANFSAANWRLFVTSRSHAQAILANEDSTQEEVNNATNTLRNMFVRAIGN